LFIVDQ